MHIGVVRNLQRIADEARRRGNPNYKNNKKEIFIRTQVLNPYCFFNSVFLD
jgi:hypothetical protein